MAVTPDVIKALSGGIHLIGAPTREFNEFPDEFGAKMSIFLDAHPTL